MKSRTRRWMTVVSLFAALAMPGCMAAQDISTLDHKTKHHQYKLIDLGTLGGPNSFLSGPGLETLNNAGMFAGYGNTSASNPNPNCYVPFNAPDCFVEHPFRWQNGALTDLPVLPGGTNSQTNWIAASGLIAGWSENGLIDPLTSLPEGNAVLWVGKKVIDLGTLPGGTESLATAVNSRGQVAGFSSDDVPDDFSLAGFPTQTRAFLWRYGAIRDLGTLGGADALAAVVNEDGQVAGLAYTNSTPNPTTGIPTLDPFLWQNGMMKDLGTLGGTLGFATWLNDRGQVVGTSNLVGDTTNHGFLWNRGTLRDLGTLGGTNSEANWISDSGLVVGRADFSPLSTNHHAFLWENGVMTDLGVVSPWPCSTALSVNASGQMVGETGICGVGGGPTFLSEHGRPMVDVNALVFPKSDIKVVDAFDINDNGEIAGAGVLLNGDVHAILLVPDGDCDDDCEGSIAASQNNTAPAQFPATMMLGSESLLSPVERYRNMMRQRYHLPGQTAAPRD
jgi:probable HAF family extracellular repeat protein